jgi:general secretion pathway protein L
MAETLILRLSALDNSASWTIVADDGSVITSGDGQLADAAGMTEQRRVIGIAPAVSVLRIAANVPLKGTAKIRQALPFALEEQVAGDIDDQHFAFTKAGADGRIPVAVVARDLIEKWQAALTAADIQLDGLYCESDGIPALPATISVFIDGDNVIIRDQHGEFTVADQDTLPIVLDMLLDQHSELMESDATAVPVDLLAYCDESTHESLSTLWDRLRMRTDSVETKMLGNGGLAFLGPLAARNGINLLQGDFAPRSELTIDLSPWKIPASLAAGLVAVVLLLQGAAYWQLTRTEAALDEAAASILQQTFPQEAGAGDPWNILQSRLGTTAAPGGEVGSGGPGFADALQALSEAFAKSNGIKLKTLGYRTGILDLQLVAPNVDALDNLRQQIDESGQFTATIQSANPDKDVIRGRMQIQAVAQ